MELTLINENEVLNDKEFFEFIRPYRDALINMQLRIDTFNQDLRHNYKDYPIHNIQQRIKEKSSLEQKLKRNNYSITIESARDHLTDIAGMRVICYFEKDVYTVESLLKKQNDLIIIKESDYIKQPKANGYRSYHIVFGVPVYYSGRTDYFPVEVQIRTLSMDLWASMEHRICYKSNPPTPENVTVDLAEYAKELKNMEIGLSKLLEDK